MLVLNWTKFTTIISLVVLGCVVSFGTSPDYLPYHHHHLPKCQSSYQLNCLVIWAIYFLIKTFSTLLLNACWLLIVSHTGTYILVFCCNFQYNCNEISHWCTTDYDKDTSSYFVTCTAETNTCICISYACLHRATAGMIDTVIKGTFVLN